MKIELKFLQPLLRLAHSSVFRTFVYRDADHHVYIELNALLCTRFVTASFLVAPPNNLNKLHTTAQPIPHIIVNGRCNLSSG